MSGEALGAVTEREPVQCQAQSVVKHAGWDALLALSYEYVADKTILSQRQHHGPLVVQKPLYPEGSEVCHTIVLHPPGGIAGGDTLEIRVGLACDSKVLLTTPGAGKWYRSSGSHASQQLNFKVARGGVLEWLPQETILFDGAWAQINTRVELEQDAVFIGWDVLCLGRAAAGEKFAQGHLQQTTRIHLEGEPIWYEAGNLHGSDPLMVSPMGLAGCTVVGTLILAGKGVPPELLALCREITVLTNEHCGITVLPNVLIARYLGHKSESAKRYFVALWELLRPFVAGREAVKPRIWQT